MKTLISIYLLSCTIFFSCHAQDKKKEQTATESHNTLKDGKLVDQKLRSFDFQSVKIPKLEALQDMSRFLEHTHAGLRELKGYSFGGVFCVEHFFTPAPDKDIEKDTVKGTLMWYCLNQAIQPMGYPKFFLATEKMEKSQVNLDLKPIRDLNIPLTTYAYSERKTDTTSVRKYLEKITPTPSCVGHVVSLPSTHESFVNGYRTFLQGHPRVGTMPFNEMDWAYFQNNYDDTVGEGVLTHLVTQQKDIKYIRYYFGYDEGKTGRNTIRVLLCAVDSTGKNITSYIVQKSIPPAFVIGTRRN